MGVCHSNKATKDSGNGARDIKNKGDATDSHAPTKLLLLGAGDVGKSTFLKQLNMVYNTGFTQAEKEDFVAIVHTNVMISIQVLLQQLVFPYADNFQLSPQNQQYKDKILHLNQDYHQDEHDGQWIDETLAEEINSLWQDSAIQRIYNSRSEKGTHNCSLYDNAGYFLNQVLAVAQKGYVPTNEDIIRCKARTTGIVELALTVDESKKYVLYDMGGQRAERRKWLHCRENVSGVVFFASCSGYDQQLVEDESINRLSEDIKLFQDVLDMFPAKPVVLVLNKKDLLREKVNDPNGRPVSDFHACYNVTGTDVYSYTLDWIENEFLRVIKATYERKVTVVQCCSTDVNDVKNVFQKIKQVMESHNFGE